MERLKGDFIWGTLLLVWIILLVVPMFRDGFMGFTEAHPYMGGFLKFFILASMGDMLGIRILKGQWIKPKGMILKGVNWGILGMIITLVFTVYFQGTNAAMVAGRLPFEGNKYVLAFFGSFIMNTTFGPMLYIYHKFGDLFIEAKMDGTKDLSVKSLVDKVDWYSIVSFSWLKTCLLIWVPLHTLVFLLPGEYRVLASAFLSVLLGIIIAISKKGNVEARELPLKKVEVNI